MDGEIEDRERERRRRKGREGKEGGGVCEPFWRSSLVDLKNQVVGGGCKNHYVLDMEQNAAIY